MTETFDDKGEALVEALKGIYHTTPPAGPSIQSFNYIQPEIYENWLTPSVALSAFPYATDIAIRQFQREMRSGRIMAAAGQIHWVGKEAQGVAHEAYLPAWIWRFADTDQSSDFWQTSYLDVSAFSTRQGYQYGTHTRFEIFDIRFNDQCFILDEPVESATPKREKPKGGRPRKGWWDDLWLEMIKRIQQGDLKPENAADLQRMMEDWLGENQIYPGDSTLKPTARKLFKYLDEEWGKN